VVQQRGHGLPLTAGSIIFGQVSNEPAPPSPLLLVVLLLLVFAVWLYFYYRLGAM